MPHSTERDEPGWLAGRVVSFAGQPLKNAWLCAWTYSESGRSLLETTGNDEGRFRLGPLPAGAAHQFWCEAPGHARLRIGEREVPLVPVFPGATHDLGDIALAEEIVATGRVLDPDGQPVADARVVAEAHINQLAGTITPNGPSIEVRTGTDGSFRIGSLAPGSLRVEIFVPGYAKVQTGASVVCTDRHIDLRIGQLSRATTPMAGTVRDRRGRPVPGVRVTANDDEEVYAETDAAGRFSLLVRAERVMYARARHPISGHGTLVGVKDPAAVELHMESPRFLEGWIRDAETMQPIRIDELNICEVRRREIDGTESFAG